MLGGLDAVVGDIQSGLSVNPDRSAPGSVVAVTPQDIMGNVFALERAVDGGWEPTVGALFGVRSDSEDEPSVVPLGEDFNYEDIGFDFPLNVLIPQDSQPGLHRICVLGDSETCAAIIIE